MTGEIDGTAELPLFGITKGLSFRGWIPTVTGRLSFSVFGSTNHPSRPIFQNVSDGDRRYLFVVQRRRTRDAIITEADHDYDFVFALIGETTQGQRNAQEYMIGKAYIVNKRRWKAAAARLNEFFDLLVAFRNCNGLTNQPEVRENLIRSKIDTTVLLDQISMCCVDFRIARTGTTDLKYNLAPADKRGRPDVPLEENQNNITIPASQIYFFLKDIGHHHQHHDPSTDTIADLYPIDDDPISDLNWRTSTLYSIYRKVIEFKRNPQVDTFNDCIGLIAYSETFQKISRIELGEAKSKDLPTYYGDEISKSIQATQSKIERQLAEKTSRADGQRNLFIAGLGIIIAYISLMQFADLGSEKIVPQRALTFVLRKLLQSPFQSVGVIYLIFKTCDWVFIRWRNSPLERLYLRLMAFSKRRTAIAFLVFVSILSGSLTIFLVLH